MTKTNKASQTNSRVNGCRIAFLAMMLSMCGSNNHVEAFTTTTTMNQPRFLSRCHNARSSALYVSSSSTTSTIDNEEEIKISVKTPIEEKVSADILSLPMAEIKERLLDLLPRMKGEAEEFEAVESYINALEHKYVPVQTLDFLNLAMGGEWQLLFSTNLLGPASRSLRLREMYQRVETKKLDGKLTNEVVWDLAEDGATFDASGTFSVKCSYTINQGARMIVDLDDHVINLASGSKVPSDLQGLVGMIHRAMPKEMFDPNEVAMDTTYLDGDLRIVRMSGSRYEGVRNIFIRRGSIEIDPTF